MTVMPTACYNARAIRQLEPLYPRLPPMATITQAMAVLREEQEAVRAVIATPPPALLHQRIVFLKAQAERLAELTFFGEALEDAAFRQAGLGMQYLPQHAIVLREANRYQREKKGYRYELDASAVAQWAVTTRPVDPARLISSTLHALIAQHGGKWSDVPRRTTVVLTTLNRANCERVCRAFERLYGEEAARLAVQEATLLLRSKANA
jgi:hypothetical protein